MVLGPFWILFEWEYLNLSFDVVAVKKIFWLLIFGCLLVAGTLAVNGRISSETALTSIFAAVIFISFIFAALIYLNRAYPTHTHPENFSVAYKRHIEGRPRVPEHWLVYFYSGKEIKNISVCPATWNQINKNSVIELEVSRGYLGIEFIENARYPACNLRISQQEHNQRPQSARFACPTPYRAPFWACFAFYSQKRSLPGAAGA